MSDFDNLYIVPSFSRINSRKDTDISVSLNDLTLEIPVIAANMDSITNANMCRHMHNNGAIAAYPRFFPVEDTKKHHESIQCPYISSIGVSNQELERFKILLALGQTHFCIDVAHGAQQQVLDFATEIRALAPKIWLMVGNFGPYLPECKPLYILADAIKLGIGPGLVCTTRKVTGVGFPQPRAIQHHKQHTTTTLCTDGGFRHAGDIAKAIALGASFTMTGALFRNTIEAADPTQYQGSASIQAYLKQNKLQGYITPEGTHIASEPTTTVKEVLQQIAGGLRSAMTYTNSRNIKEFQNGNSVSDFKDQVLEIVVK